MEPAAAAVLAPCRRLFVRLGKALPEVFRGTTIQDLESARKKGERAYQILKGTESKPHFVIVDGDGVAVDADARASQLLEEIAGLERKLRETATPSLRRFPQAAVEALGKTGRRWTWVYVVGGIIFVLVVGGGCVYLYKQRRSGREHEGAVARDADAPAHPPPPAAAAAAPRRVVVSHRLPLRAEPNSQARFGFEFSLDTDALPLLLSRGLPRPVVFVGGLPTAAESIPASVDLQTHLIERFSCSPMFLGVGLHDELSVDRQLYNSYLTADSLYADRAYELVNPGEHLVFIHEFHPLGLPVPALQKLSQGDINPSYHRTGNRLILVDCDTIVMSEGGLSQELIRVLKELCLDPKNTVFVLSGQMNDELARWLAPARLLHKELGKGTVMAKLLSAIGARGNMPDFVFCLGDNGSDEALFAAITTLSRRFALPQDAEVFACTLGNKPSSAKYFLEDSMF